MTAYKVRTRRDRMARDSSRGETGRHETAVEERQMRDRGETEERQRKFPRNWETGNFPFLKRISLKKIHPFKKTKCAEIAAINFGALAEITITLSLPPCAEESTKGAAEARVRACADCIEGLGCTEPSGSELCVLRR